MKWIRICALIIFFGLIVIINVYAAANPHCGYSGPNDPKNRGDLASDTEFVDLE